MSADDCFQAMLLRVRAGDEDAAAEVVRRYEPALRRLIRMRLTDPHLTRLLDSMDVCQSVLANSFGGPLPGGPAVRSAAAERRSPRNRAAVRWRCGSGWRGPWTGRRGNWDWTR